MVIDLVAPSLVGHRLNYIRVLLQHSSRAEGLRVVTSSAGAPGQVETLRQLVDTAGAQLLLEGVGPRDNARWAARTASSSRPTLAMELDNLLTSLVRLPARGQIGGLLMRPWGSGRRGLSPRSRASQTVKRLVVGRMLRNGQLTGVGLLRQSCVPDFDGGPIYEVPDPIVLPKAPPDRSPRSDSSITVAMVGGIDVRKRPELVAEAVAKLDVASANPWRLHVHGKLTPAAWDSLAGFIRSGIVHVEDRWLADEEMWDRINAADMVACIHRNPGSSGVVGLAVGLGTPVVVAHIGEPARYVERTGAGLVVTRLTTSGVAHTLALVHERRAELSAAARAQRKTLQESPRQFASALDRLMPA